MLSRDAVERFRKLYQERFGKEISYEEALEQGAKLVRLLELVYRPMSKDEFNRLQQRRRETGDMP